MRPGQMAVSAAACAGLSPPQWATATFTPASRAARAITVNSRSRPPAMVPSEAKT